jgi:ribonuclease Z
VERLRNHLVPIRKAERSSLRMGAAMAKRAGVKHLMLTHMIPPIGGEQYPFKLPGGLLTEGDYTKAAQDGGFTGNIIVGTDLASLRLPAK